MVEEKDSYMSLRIREHKLLEIHHDENYWSPREWENVGTMAIFHNRYDFGDTVPFSFQDFQNWQEMEKHIQKEFKAVAILPIYMYDHSGQSIRTTPFGDRWDSGQIGFIYAEKDHVKECYDTLKITKQVVKKVMTTLENEVRIMNDYITGNVFRYEFFKVFSDLDYERDNTKVWLGSCGGFYGNDFWDNGLMDQANIKKEDVLDYDQVAA